MLLTNYLGFSSSKMSWFPFHFWRIFSLDVEFWFDSFSALYKCCAPSFRTPWFLMRNMLFFELLLLGRWGIPSFWLHDYYLSLVFRNFILMCLGVYFVRFWPWRMPFSYACLPNWLSQVGNPIQEKSTAWWLFFFLHALLCSVLTIQSNVGESLLKW